MLVLLTVLTGATLIFLLWFYHLRTKVSVPISPGGHWLYGHLGPFMSIKDPDDFEKIYLELVNPKNGDVSHLKFLHVSNLSFNSVYVAEDLLKSNVNINKSFQYDLFGDWIKGSVLILPGEQWHKRRKILTPAFHFNVLDSFYEVMKHSSSRLHTKLSKLTESGPAFIDICNLLKLTTFNTLVETSFGFHSEAFGKDNKIFVAMEDLVKAFIERPKSVLNYFNCIFSRTEGGRLGKKSLDTLNDFIRGMIEDRRRAKAEGKVKLHKGKHSFLDHMINIQDENPGELTDEDLIGECNTIMLAGHGTVTGTVGFILYYLCKHQDIQQRVFDEIEQEIKDSSINDLQTQNLTYLTMVIKETLRLQPAAPNVARRLSEPMIADGYLIPTGTNVDINIWWIQRDPRVWPDPLKFDPERFTAENMRKRNPFAFVPFSAGPRNCLGFRFAMMEMRILVSYLIYNFKVTTEQTMGIELKRHIDGIVIFPGPDLKIKFEKRQ